MLFIHPLTTTRHMFNIENMTSQIQPHLMPGYRPAISASAPLLLKKWPVHVTGLMVFRRMQPFTAAKSSLHQEQR